MVETLPLPSPFLRSWWLEATGNGRPLFLLVLEDGALIGGLALEEDRWCGVARLRFLGAGPLCPDHLDLVAAPRREGAVVGAVAAWLRRKNSRVIDLEGAVVNSRVRAALPGRVREEILDIAPWARLPARSTDYIASLPATLRKTVRTASRRLDSAGVSHRVITEPAGADEALDALKSLVAARWGDQARRFLARFDDFAAAARDGIARGEVVFHELASNGEVFGVLACFEVAGRASLYHWGRDPDHRWGGIGPVLLFRALERSCELGLVEIDLLRGSEPYKRRFAPHARELVRLRAAHGAAGWLVLAILEVWTKLRRLGGRLKRRLMRFEIRRPEDRS